MLNTLTFAELYNHLILYTMRTLLTIVFTGLLFVTAHAQDGGKVIAQSTTETVGGIGGYTDVFQVLKAGDKITIEARAHKLLSGFFVYQSGHKLIGKVKDTKKINYSFTVPTDDSIRFHFVSDRGGSNKIDYTITKNN